MSAAAGALWRMPGSFATARLLGGSYWLRCVVFHHIATSPSPFTAGISVSVTPKTFEDAMRFIAAHYAPVSLEDALSQSDAHRLPKRALLVTFDDAYASVAEWAAPLCRKYRVPAVFFVNAAFLDNQRLAPDNLVCYVASALGLGAVQVAARTVPGWESRKLNTLADVFGRFFPSITLAERGAFLDALRQKARVDEGRLASEAKLYLTSKQLRGLQAFDFEIGNHTYTHTHCRRFSNLEFTAEIDRNKTELEAVTGSKVRSFSQPYGSSEDLTPALVERLQRSGHRAAFLSESVANARGADPMSLDRVSTSAEGDENLFLEIEVLPRLRAIRNHVFRRRASASASAAQDFGEPSLHDYLRTGNWRKRA
jgi:peptidoglycan/xylan/chitin deacetylase (PgdA/CDA1 family)